MKKMEEESLCEGCIYLIRGERKDRKGYAIKTSACLCEKEMAASCIPTYEFGDWYIYKGKIIIINGFMEFRKQRNKALKENVTFPVNINRKERRLLE